MTVNYKYCSTCHTKVSLNSTQCLVCNGRDFITQEELDQAAKDIHDQVSSQKACLSTLRWCLAWLILACIVLAIAMILTISFRQINWPIVPGRVL
jgi:uncharacterized membrane protein YccF (DUF307 family)